ncbi:hypothetical protein [Streptomyces sp. 35G-GA-8]|uniref:hypothetical protein n=1 Tax=Streptomyces sp. 35G-GA-8 TaxID=2939434 RepID=UPI00201F710E|nr:hypothetical protein [Streptomyces sp. 35G-GA-8]MCL7381281.1 hypothetical protein [Streptomyces sp. 35G-GA-8]
MRQVTPLGLFGSISGQSRFSRNAEEIKELSGQIPVHERARVAEYLRAAPVIIALMGHTEDVLGQKFSVMGGSALHSDGTYYWRRDTAEYVETYGTRLPSAFMEHGARVKWIVPPLTDEEVMEIDDFFMSLRAQG